MKLFYIISKEDIPEMSMTMTSLAIVNEADYNSGYNVSYGVEGDDVRNLLEQNMCYEMQEGIYEVATSVNIETLKTNLNNFGLEEKEMQ